MKNGEAATAPQGRNSVGANLVLDSPDGDNFDLWVDNREIFSGTEIECEHYKDTFAAEFGIPHEKFTLVKRKPAVWALLDGRRFIDMNGVQ